LAFRSFSVGKAVGQNRDYLRAALISTRNCF
jgi:hypothetical protein